MQLWSRFKGREKRLIVYLLIVLGFAAWRLTPRPWHPTTTIETQHYSIASTATRDQTEEIARVVEILYQSYSNRFSTLPNFQRQHHKLKLRLYKDREEFLKINPGLGWAEAFYRKPYCHAYYSARETNPYHWMLHEAVHQLNQEVAQLRLAKWIEEGLAEYFSTSRLTGNELALGHIDPNTYPLWWIDNIATHPALETNMVNGTVIPLRTIITGRGGPRMNSHVNLYYLHWWSLTHFLFEHPKHGEAATRLLASGASIESFEAMIGGVEAVEQEWHKHVRRVRDAMAGHDVNFLRTGKLPSEESKAMP